MKHFIASLLTAVVCSRGDTLNTYEAMYEGDGLNSNNGAYTAILQTDGNFVVYKNPNNYMWDSNTNNS